MSFKAILGIKSDENTLCRITFSYGKKGWNEAYLVMEAHENAQVLKELTTLTVSLIVSSNDIRDYMCKDCTFSFFKITKHFNKGNSHGFCGENLKSFQLSGNGNDGVY